MIPRWLSVRCLRCVACIGICPERALLMRESGMTVQNERCVGCGICIRICPVGALEEGKE